MDERIPDPILFWARDIALELFKARKLVDLIDLPDEVQEAVTHECEHCLRPPLENGELGYHAADVLRAISQIRADQMRPEGEPRRPVWPHCRPRVE